MQIELAGVVKAGHQAGHQVGHQGQELEATTSQPLRLLSHPDLNLPFVLTSSLRIKLLLRNLPSLQVYCTLHSNCIPESWLLLILSALLNSIDPA